MMAMRVAGWVGAKYAGRAGIRGLLRFPHGILVRLRRVRRRGGFVWPVGFGR